MGEASGACGDWTALALESAMELSLGEVVTLMSDVLMFGDVMVSESHLRVTSSPTPEGPRQTLLGAWCCL